MGEHPPATSAPQPQAPPRPARAQNQRGTPHAVPKRSDRAIYVDYRPPRLLDMHRKSFDEFYAVDWSGAQTAYGHKLQVAQCVEHAANEAPPQLRLRNPRDTRLATTSHRRTHQAIWTRTDILNFVIGLTQRGAAAAPVLVGFDFSFAPPRAEPAHDESSAAAHSQPACKAAIEYWPGLGAHTARDLWACVDATVDDADLGAASFITKHWPDQFYRGRASGDKHRFARWRTCERHFNAGGGGKAATIFDAMGAAQVAKASFAGMRMLHHLSQHPAIAIWPFMPITAAHRVVVVEIYCRAFLKLAGGNGQKLRTRAQLTAALAQLGAPRLPRHATLAPLTDDKTDALVAAAGLRTIANIPAYWQPPGLTPDIATTEGWTFGVGAVEVDRQAK